MSNLKQIGLAINMYADDYDDWYPSVHGDGVLKWYVNGSFMEYLNLKAYASNKKGTVFNCPSHPGGCWPGPFCNNFIYISYAANELLGSSVFTRHKRGKYKTPSQTMGFCDGNYYCVNYTGTLSNISYRHSGGANVLYLDGHVGWKQEGTIPTSSIDPFWN